MRILKGHRFRLDLDEAQAAWCSRTAGICRFLWNLALEQRSMAWNFGRHVVGYFEQAGELPELKKAHPWLAEAPSHCLQQTLRDLDAAFGNFFQGRAAYPAFRKKFQRDRFRFPDPVQFTVNEEERWLKLPKLGQVAYRNGKGRHALKLAGRPKSITVTRDGGHWYASVLCEAEVAEPVPVQGPPVGVDLGVVRSLTLSTGEVLTVAGLTRDEARRQARLQRALARKRKGSSNRHKARLRLARFQARSARRRRDSIHKITTRLAKSHGQIVLEDLRVKAMTASAAGTLEAPGTRVKAKAGLNRAILNVAFGEIRRQLEYKCRWHGSVLQVVNPAYTSQKCHACQFTHAANRHSQADFVCGNCGHRANADVNAARNILEAGQSLPAVGRTVDACGGKASAARRSRKPVAQAPGIPFL
jgi:putative transposase